MAMKSGKFADTEHERVYTDRHLAVLLQVSARYKYNGLKKQVCLEDISKTRTEKITLIIIVVLKQCKICT